MAAIADIIKSVRTILDHNLSSTELEDLTEVQTLDLDTLIRDSVRPAAMQLMQMVPVELADVKNVQAQGRTEIRPDGSIVIQPIVPPVTIPIPDDYLRFVSCKTGEWDYPLTRLSEAGSREHMRQYGEFGGLKATAHKPVAVIAPSSNGTEGGMEIILYGGRNGHQAEVSYIGMPYMDDTSIEIGVRLYDPLCYIIAALACECLKDTQKSQYMIQTARSLMTPAERAAEQTIMTNT